MKTDFELLFTLLIVLRAISGIRLTKRHTVIQPQFKALKADILHGCNLAYYKSTQYLEDDNVLGKKFFYLFAAFNHLHSAAVPNVDDGTLGFIRDSDSVWMSLSRILHAGFSKNDGMDIFERKRKLCFLALEILMGVGYNPTLVPKKANSILDQLLERSFTYGLEELDFENPGRLNDLDHYRYDVVCAIYRSIGLIYQMATLSREGKGRKTPHESHIDWYGNKPNRMEVSAIGHMVDVLWARSLLNIEYHKPFTQPFLNRTDKKT